MKTAFALLALLGATSLVSEKAGAAAPQSLPQAIDKSITEKNVSTAINELKKDAENLKARLKLLEASLPREEKKTKTLSSALPANDE